MLVGYLIIKKQKLIYATMTNFQPYLTSTQAAHFSG